MLRSKRTAVLAAALIVVGGSAAGAASGGTSDSQQGTRSIVEVQAGTGMNNTWTCPAPASAVDIPIENVSDEVVAVTIADGNGSSLLGASWSYSATSVELAPGAEHQVRVTITAVDGMHPTGKLTVSFSVAGARANAGDDWHIHVGCDDVASPTDVTAPSLTWDFSGDEGRAGWYVTGGDVLVTCDDGAGAYPGSGGGPLLADGRHELELTCSDAAGNTTTETATVEIDSVVPTVTWSGDRVYDVDEAVQVSCQAADSGSGLATSTCGTAGAQGPAHTLDLGSHDLSASATDVAGNETRSSATYAVVPTGEGTCRLLPQLVVNHGVASSLCVKIRNSQAAAARGQAKTELNVLDAFDQEVRAQASKKIVAGGDAVLLRISSWLRGH